MINYYCPDFVEGLPVYDILLNLFKQERPDIFYENVNIKAVFGMFPFSIWNGGGYSFGVYDYDEIYQVFNFYSSMNIPLQFTLTNPCLEERDLYDRKSNKVIELFHNENNLVLVSTPLMEQYIRENYPKYKICRSIINTAEDYNFELMIKEKYDSIVLPRRHEHNIDFLKSIKKEYRSSIELLCNDPCPPLCPNIYKHYELYGQGVLGTISPYAIHCENEERLNNIFKECQEYQIKYNDIINTYLPLGYTSFKLSGRGSTMDVAFNIVNYLIKPEYRVRVLYIIYNSITQ